MLSDTDKPMSTGAQIQLDEQIPGAYPANDAAPAVSSQKTMYEAVRARRAEFTRPQSVRIKVGTWNVAAKTGTEKDIGSWFVGGKGVEEALTGLALDDTSTNDPDSEHNLHRESVEAQEARRTEKEPTVPENDHGSVPGDDGIGIYALGLQEIIDINSAKSTLRPYGDDSKRFKKALEAALPTGYELVAEQQLIGLLILVYASPKMIKDIRAVSTASVGTGLMGYMGNKGATTARLVLGETTRLVFVNSHMSAGVGKAELERRNWDAQQILTRTKFTPIEDVLGHQEEHGEKIGDEDFAFWFGDLNYRLEGIPGDDVRRLLMLHTRHEYDIHSNARQSADETLARDVEAAKDNPESSLEADTDASTLSSWQDTTSVRSLGTWDTNQDTLDPHDDPASLQTTLASLLPHDELHQQQKLGKAFADGWKEGPITFVPTYKYDVGSVGVFDSSEKRRAPSWCDRILFRTRNDRLEHEQKLKDQGNAQERDEYMKSQGIQEAAKDEDTLFEYDPEADGDDGDEELETSATGLPPSASVTKEGYEDSLQLEYYISHQRVLSSDHKPLDAIFTLKYDAVVPDLKAKVHQEVAKDLDRAENEARPILTLAVDHGGAVDAGVGFGEVRFGEVVSRHITLANTGQVKAEFGLVRRPLGGDSDFGTTSNWLKAYFDIPTEQRPKTSRKSVDDWSFNVPESVSLVPGDTCNLELTIQVRDNTLLRDLNDGAKLDDVVILRVRDGRDHFIPVHGEWLASSFGRSIDSMCRVPEGGIRQGKWRPGSSATSEDKQDAVIWSAPREIFRLTESVEKMTERLLAEWSMTNTDDSSDPPWVTYAGWPFVPASWVSDGACRDRLSRRVREALDLDEEIATHLLDAEDAVARVEAISETLLSLLESLQDGVVPGPMWAQLEDDFFSKPQLQTESDLEDQRARVLEILATSRNHSVTFVLLTSMMAHVAQEVAGTQSAISPSMSKANTHLPTSPMVQVKKQTLDSNPVVARRQLVRKNFAAVFAPLIIRIPETSTGKGKALAMEHANKIIDIFLETPVG